MICCPDKVVKRENMFFWRGRFYSGLVCPEHNSLWDNPEDSFFEGVRKSNEVAQEKEKE